MNKETNATTQTDVKTQNWEGNFKEMVGEERTIPAPVFIIFAEYMGYVSQFNKKAEDWCDGRVPEVHVQKIMILEAKSIFRQMVKDFGIEDIKYYYDSYYPLILKDYVDALEEILKND